MARAVAKLVAICVMLSCLAVSVAARAGRKASVAPPFPSARDLNPQFILLTNDDSVSPTVHKLLRSVTDGRRSATGGCPAVATMFAVGRLDYGQKCALVKDLHKRGYEIADHTFSHVSLKGKPAAAIEKEVSWGRAALAACGVPAADIVGFRAPLLETDAAVRAALRKLKFEYDSSLLEETTGQAGSVSKGINQRAWPFDMANGVPLKCSWYSSIQSCSPQERLAGLWQVPIWPQWLGGQGWSMDPGMSPPASVFEVLKTNFDAAYGGNRAPMPIFGHEFWLTTPGVVEDLKRFLDYALARPDVYMVTMRQLIGWMKKPVPANQLTPQALGCGKPGGTPGTGKPGPARPLSRTPAWTPPATPRATPPTNNSTAPPTQLPNGPPVAVSGGKCGAGVAVCSIGECCSQFGYCGNTPAHCGAGCQLTFGACAQAMQVAVAPAAEAQPATPASKLTAAAAAGVPPDILYLPA